MSKCSAKSGDVGRANDDKSARVGVESFMKSKLMLSVNGRSYGSMYGTMALGSAMLDYSSVWNSSLFSVIFGVDLVAAGAEMKEQRRAAIRREKRRLGGPKHQLLTLVLESEERERERNRVKGLLLNEYEEVRRVFEAGGMAVKEVRRVFEVAVSYR